MSRSRILSLLASAALLMSGGAALAEKGIDRHELPPRVTAITRQGKPGFRVTVRLHAVSYDRVRVGLGRMNAGIPRRGDYDTRLRLLAAGEEKGYLRAQFPELCMPKNCVVETSFEAVYGEGNDLKPGDQVDVISAWYGPKNPKMTMEGKQYDFWHIFGMYDGPAERGDVRSVITLP